MKRILVWLSWWVDSAVAAYRLIQQGFDVTAGFMINYTTDDETCTTKQDLAEAQKVADYLGIKLHIFDYQEEYNKRIVQYIIDSYQQGLTPNPDILCNSEIKFNVFLDEGIALGFDAIATGHYAQIQRNHLTLGEITYEHSHYFDSELTEKNPTSSENTATTSETIDKHQNDIQRSSREDWQQHIFLEQGYYSLIKWVDTNKDQSYFLAWLTQHQLSKAIFPLWWLTKPEVREIAKKAWLPNADRKDSQWICFIWKVPMKEFLQQYIPVQKGNIVDTDGKKLGEHDGIWWYTVGQRQWLWIAAPHPLFVIKKDKATNTLVVGYADAQELYSSEIQVSNWHWIGKEVALPRSWHAKIRYRQADQEVKIERSSSTDWQEDIFVAHFSQPQRAVASGQILVAYDWEQVVGSGIIV